MQSYYKKMRIKLFRDSILIFAGYKGVQLN